MTRKKLFKLVGAICLAAVIAIPFAAGCAAPTPTPAPAPAPAPTPAPAPAPAPAPTPPPAAEVLNWKMQTFFSPGGKPVYWEVLKQYSDDVKTMSQGALNIELFAVGEIAPFTEQVDATGQGILEASLSFTNQWAGKNAAHEMLGGFAFSEPNFQLKMWYTSGDGQKYMDILYHPYNVQALPVMGHFLEVGGHSKFPIYSLDDMIGKRYRTGSGMPHEILKRLGVDPFWCAVAEGYTTLDRGLADILKMGTAVANFAAGYHEVAPYAFWPGWTTVGNLSGVNEINLDNWNALPEHLKRMVRTANDRASWYFEGEEAYQSGEALQKMIEYGVTITKLDKDSLQKMKNAADEVVADLSDENPLFKEIYENRKEFHKNYDILLEYATIPPMD